MHVDALNVPVVRMWSKLLWSGKGPSASHWGCMVVVPLCWRVCCIPWKDSPSQARLVTGSLSHLRQFGHRLVSHDLFSCFGRVCLGKVELHFAEWMWYCCMCKDLYDISIYSGICQNLGANCRLLFWDWCFLGYADGLRIKTPLCTLLLVIFQKFS